MLLFPRALVANGDDIMLELRVGFEFGTFGHTRSAAKRNSRVLLIDTDSQAHATLVTTNSLDLR